MDYSTRKRGKVKGVRIGIKNSYGKVNIKKKQVQQQRIVQSAQ
jgi:hypothetical protein